MVRHRCRSLRSSTYVTKLREQFLGCLQFESKRTADREVIEEHLPQRVHATPPASSCSPAASDPRASDGSCRRVAPARHSALCGSAARDAAHGAARDSTTLRPASSDVTCRDGPSPRLHWPNARRPTSAQTARRSARYISSGSTPGCGSAPSRGARDSIGVPHWRAAILWHRAPDIGGPAVSPDGTRRAVTSPPISPITSPL